VHPSSLLDALSELFEAMWDKAVPLNQRPAPDDEDRILTDRDKDLLGLLAAGTTDETIARTFGWSVRTVRRHIHRIMTMTGAETRFQAGMEATRRGWLLWAAPAVTSVRHRAARLHQGAGYSSGRGTCRGKQLLKGNEETNVCAPACNHQRSCDAVRVAKSVL